MTFGASPRPGLVVASLVAVAALGACKRRPPASEAAPQPMTVSPPELARRADTTYDLHGERIADPYQWLEDESAAEVKAFMTAHDDFARAQLAALEARPAFAKRLAELSYLDSRSAPRVRGKRRFWSEKPADKEKSVYYWQEEGDEPRVLLDPLEMAPDGTLALGDVVPSPDGKLVAYLEKPDNADESNLKVLEVETGALREADTISGLRYTSPSWSVDGSGFYYTWIPDDPEIPTNERMGFGEIRYHRLGSDPAEDERVRGKTGDATKWQGAAVSDDGSWLVVTVSEGWSRTELFVKRLSKKGAKWVHLTEGLEPAIYEAEGYGDTLYVRTNAGAPKYRLFAVQAGRFDRKAWKELVPEGEDRVLDGVHLIGGRLVAHFMEKASSRLSIFGLDGKLSHAVELPGLGSVASLTGKAGQDDFYFGFESFDRPYELYRASASTGALEVFHRAEVPLEPGSLNIQQVVYPSKDGTEISMFVVGRPETKRDGAQPTLLYGYGGFNISLTPSFSPMVVAWVESGGVYAVPNLRGGGEYGEAWHEAGMLEKKQNVFDDFLTAAQYLIDEKYTSPEHLGISGRSNGGLLVGAAMTQRPELFSAVVCGVPLLDMLRYHQFGIGRAWIPEYGTAERAEDARWLKAYSPYHRVREGTVYPALLMLSADHDDRVDPLHARKLVAAVRAADGGEAPKLLRIERNSGHGGGDMRSKRIERTADELAFLASEL